MTRGGQKSNIQTSFYLKVPAQIEIFQTSDTEETEDQASG